MVQETDRSQDLDRDLVASLQRLSASLQSVLLDADGVQDERVRDEGIINQPGQANPPTIDGLKKAGRSVNHRDEAQVERELARFVSFIRTVHQQMAGHWQLRDRAQ